MNAGGYENNSDDGLSLAARHCPPWRPHNGHAHTSRLWKLLGAASMLLAGMSCGRIDYEPLAVDAAAQIDAGLAPQCQASWLSNGVIAAYSMDTQASELVDRVGAHPGTVANGPLEVAGVCGQALEFGGTARVVIPDSQDWQLTSGSVDFWAYFGVALPTLYDGVVSRDALGRVFPGHLAVVRSFSGQLGVRIQGNVTSMLCSNSAMPTERWVHIGFNFGEPGPELYVNGVSQAGEGSVQVNENGATVRCNDPAPVGIAGNANPWVLGIGSLASDDGGAGPNFGPMEGGRIDEFRISRERRDFSMVRDLF